MSLFSHVLRRDAKVFESAFVSFPRTGCCLWRTERFIVGLIVIFWFGLVGYARAQSYEFQRLGFLPGGNWSRPTAISHDGSTVVGSAKDSNAASFPFRWTVASGMQALSSGRGFGPLEEVFGVSADGSVVVGWGYEKIGEGYERRAARWTNGGVQHLGTLGGNPSWAWGVSSDGAWVVGESYLSTPNRTHAFRWSSATGMQDLGSLPGRYLTEATAVSADGAVVVGSSGMGSSSSRHAFVWTPSTGMQDLGTLGGDRSVATDVSDDGSVVVGYSQIADSTYRAFRWTESTGMVALPALTIRPAKISPDGSTIIVWGLISSGGDTRNLVWTAETGMLDLDSLIIHHYGFSDWRSTIFDIGVRDFTLTDNRLILTGGYSEAWRLVLEPWPLNTCAPVIAWDGEGDGTSFSDSLNWVGDRVPGQGDIARFDTTGGAPAVQLDQDVINTGLIIRDIVQMDLQGRVYGLSGDCGTPLQVDGLAQFTLEEGTLRTLLGEVRIGPSEAPELILRNDGLLEMLGLGRFIVAARDTAQVSVLGGGRLQLPDNTLVIGDSTYPGRVLVEATADSTVLRAGEILIGEGNDGILRIEGGSALTGTLRMGELVGSEARAVVFGSGSLLTVTDGTRIGIRGNATLSVHSFGRLGLPADGGPEWVLGADPEGEGTLELIGGSELVSLGGTLVIGERGRGHVAVIDGSRAEDLGLVWVGRKVGSAGSLTVGAGYPGGAPSRMTVEGMCVGCGGTGVVSVDSVSLLQVDRLQVGSQGIVRGPVLALTTTTFDLVGPVATQEEAFVLRVTTQDTTETLELGSGPTDSVGIWVKQIVLQEDGRIEVDSVIFYPGGELGGSGVFPLDLVNRGVVAPGDTLGHTDTLVVAGSYVQTAEGILEVEVGDQSDLLLVTGDAHFDGTLRIGVAAGFAPQVGDTFVVVQYGGRGSGAFSQIEFLQGLDGVVSYGSGFGEVVITAVTGIGDEMKMVATEYVQHQNYPNPFEQVTRIEFTLPAASRVRLVVYDFLGREVKTLVSGYRTAGSYVVQWDGTDTDGQLVPGGVYLYHLQIDGYTIVGKMMLLR